MPSLVTGRLPVRLTPLVGRQRELREVVDSLSRGRLLTLTGPGGIGKTRLALAAASAVSTCYPEGVCWVELAPLDDPGIVARVVARRVGVPDCPGQDATAAIVEHIGDRSMLIVLDNCEHLASAVAVLAEQLLGACHALSILATSREVLGVDGECSWPVPPLSLPEDGVPAADALAQSDAVRFFEYRARLVFPSFRLADDNAPAVVQVCRRLDGLPLAIELAAAQMRMLSVGQLAERLDDIFTVLVGGARTAPRRHQALRATLDWSYDLLGGDERVVFRRLAVFTGGFTLTAAEQVAAGSGIRPQRMLELLTRLADKSLLRVDHMDSGTRYHLLGTIREYALERLAEASEAEATRRSHLRCFAGLVEEVTPRIDGGREGPVRLERELDRLDAEIPNLRVALEFAAECGDADAALRIAGPLGRFAYLRGHYHEIREWMDTAVTAGTDAPAALRAKALLGSGRLALLQCDYRPAVRRLEAALRLYRELGDAQGVASALQVLGSVAREQGRYARAMQLHMESLSIAEAAGDRWAVASAHGYLGFASWLQADFERATKQCTVALHMFRELGDVEGIAWSLLSLGTIARHQGAREQAASLLQDSRSLAERIGFREGIAWSLEQLGLLAADQGDPAAAALLRTSLEIHHDLRDRWRTCSVLEDLAAIALAQGSPQQAARLLAAAEAMRATIGTVIAPCDSAQHAATMTGARAALGGEAFATAWQHGLLAQIDDLQADLAPPGTAVGSQPADQRAAWTDPPVARAVSHRKPSATARKQDTRTTAATSGILRIRALGAATVHRGDTALTAADWGYAKPRELLFLLAASPPMTREQLGAALWPDLSPQQLGNALHTALRELRRALGDPGWVVYSDGRYRFNTAREHECDIETFEQALTAARAARPAATALPHLQRAVAAYGGDFLAGMAAGEWAQARRDELARSFESALLATGRLHAAAGRYQPAAAAFRRAVAHEPLNETAHRELMNCWVRLGETARAVRHYEELAELLQDQVGVPPAAETTALYRRLAGRP
ncbi:MAG: BTAD domain-containing putative transcriptional regulator [Micromonosporaceae bacterium]